MVEVTKIEREGEIIALRVRRGLLGCIVLQVGCERLLYGTPGLPPAVDGILWRDARADDPQECAIVAALMPAAPVDRALAGSLDVMEAAQ